MSIVNNRSIAGIIVPCTISEVHSDTATITNHPVEYGAPISDHMFINPIRCEVVVGYNDAIGIDFGSMQVFYDAFLSLQYSTTQVGSEPFTIYTGKRVLNNMVLESIEETTNVNTENIVKLTLRFREVIIVNTQSVEAPTSSQADAPNTATPAKPGVVQLSTKNAASLGPRVDSQGIPGVLNSAGLSVLDTNYLQTQLPQSVSYSGLY